MKKIKILFLVIITFLIPLASPFAATFGSQKIKPLQFDILFKGTHSSEIVSINFFETEEGKGIITLSKDGTVKLWNIKKGELLNTYRIKGKDFITATKNNDHIYVLSENKLYYIGNNGDVIETVEGQFSWFKPLSYGKILLLYSNGTMEEVDLINRKTVRKVNIGRDFSTRFYFLPDGKHFIAYSNRKVGFFTKSGNLISEIIPQGRVEIAIPISNRYIYVEDGWNDIVRVYELKTSKVVLEKKGGKFFGVAPVNKDEILLSFAKYSFDPRKVFLLNIVKNSITNTNVSGDGLVLSKDKSLLGTFINNQFTVYKTPFTKTVVNTSIEKEGLSETENQTAETTTTSVPKNEPQEENLPPKLVVEAHPQEGFTPLKVNVSIFASDDSKIVAHFISVDGKGKIGKGTPPASISITFKNPGEHKVVIAVKDDSGKITKKTIIFKAKEKSESFSDYKKEFEEYKKNFK
ncbi:WD40 repeat domain-containing protein [Desulfurobacterium atlanticum]|uniref:Uncharacterized protein n=1 Tax=Desulfurobacterium atlanticum TaxID=240169 RepID=A0A238Z920_9BACT|nr:WD40 repeat domain-containing protein [Desulfurobacterium atlanticum]SNR79471.1 hypothetical protein SAMN06265340_10721 [Desulfurobacterium atlanticum]